MANRKLALVKSDPMKLFTTGKLKISGNVMASQKLSFLQKMDPEQAKQAAIKARAAGGGPGKAGAAAAAGPTAKAPAFFAALSKRLGEKPELAKELGAIVLFKIVDPGSEWTVEGAAVSPADFGTAKTTLTPHRRHRGAPRRWASRLPRRPRGLRRRGSPR